jgi:hypothetical protein
MHAVIQKVKNAILPVSLGPWFRCGKRFIDLVNELSQGYEFWVLIPSTHVILTLAIFERFFGYLVKQDRMLI